MYIAITRKKYKNTYHKQILLRESYREDRKVKSRTIANLTNKPKDQVDAIVAALKNTDEPVSTYLKLMSYFTPKLFNRFLT